MPRRHRKMKGGFLDSLGSTLSDWGTSISQGASSAWNKTKSATIGTPSTSYTPSASYTPSTNTETTSTETTYTPTTNTETTYTSTSGGKKTKKRHRKMRGGFSDNTPTTGLAATASSISGIKSAQPHNWVGAKTKRHRKNKKTKSSKSRKH